MNTSLEIEKRIREAEKRVKELLDEGNLKKLDDREKESIALFYEQKSLHRVQSARLIFEASTQQQNYADFSEVVSACYYAMYYIVHAFLAKKYGRKLREGVRGVHAITVHLILYYLVKTKKLEKYLYEEYCNALETATELSTALENEFQVAAFRYVEKYKQEQTKREKFTYFVSKNAEQQHATDSLDVAQEFINTIRQLMIK